MGINNPMNFGLPNSGMLSTSLHTKLPVFLSVLILTILRMLCCHMCQGFGWVGSLEIVVVL